MNRELNKEKRWDGMVKVDKFRNLVQDSGSLLLLKYEKGERKPVDLNHPEDKNVICSMWRKGDQEVSVQLSPLSTPCPIPWPNCWGSSLLSLLIQTRRAEHEVNWPNTSYQAHKTERIKLPLIHKVWKELVPSGPENYFFMKEYSVLYYVGLKLPKALNHLYLITCSLTARWLLGIAHPNTLPVLSLLSHPHTPRFTPPRLLSESQGSLSSQSLNIFSRNQDVKKWQKEIIKNRLENPEFYACKCCAGLPGFP